MILATSHRKTTRFPKQATHISVLTLERLQTVAGGTYRNTATIIAKKYAEVTKHQHKRILALTSGKFVRLVFGLLVKK